MRRRSIAQRLLVAAVTVSLLAGPGCRAPLRNREIVNQLPPPPAEVPRELCKVTLPAYTVEPPDILLVDAIRIVPKEPYRLTPLDALFITAEGTYPDQPIQGAYPVLSGGTIDLGFSYGTVPVAGMTVGEARTAVESHLAKLVQSPRVTVALAEAAAKQQIAGEHLVCPDGTVNLGTYGTVQVAGLTLDAATMAIEAHLAQYLEAPDVAVDVFAYNSKVYYVITEGGGYGDSVTRFPVTGNETVLDAISQVNGLQSVSSKKIWVARPAPNNAGCFQVMPVDWRAITKGAETTTNYQILPGDRVFIAEDHWVAFDTVVGKLVSPFERIFGFTLLGTATIQQINRFPKGGGAGGLGFGGGFF